MDLDEHKIFRDYHEARVKRKKAEIEAGLVYPDETDIDLYLDDLTAEEIAEMKAKSELQEYADAIRVRQEKFAMKDVAQMIVENKVLIDRVDEALDEKPTGDIGTSYDELSSRAAASGDFDR